MTYKSWRLTEQIRERQQHEYSQVWEKEHVVPEALDERAVEPLNVVAVWVEQQDFVAYDREGQKEHRPYRHRKREDTKQKAYSIDLELVLLGWVEILAVTSSESLDQCIASHEQQQKQQHKDLEELKAENVRNRQQVNNSSA